MLAVLEQDFERVRRSKLRRTVGLTLLALGVSFALGTAQSARSTFDVASVKPHIERPAGASNGMSALSGRRAEFASGVFRVTNVTVSDLIQFAYGIKTDQVVNGPDWIRSERFDVNAKAETPPTDAPSEQLKLMVQSLLEDRFRLLIRKEHREAAQFALVLARGDAALGPNLSSADRIPIPSERPAGVRLSMGRGTMAEIATMVSRRIGAPVTDKTGLTGSYFYQLITAPDSPSSSPDRPPADPQLLPFVDALREQLGLKLERTRGPIEFFVIESVSRPTPD